MGDLGPFHVKNISVMRSLPARLSQVGKEGSLSLSLGWRLFKGFVTYSGA